MRKFGLIGYPLGQSFSKKFFTEKFKKEQLNNCAYDVFPLENIEKLNDVLTDPELEGLNVTIPYKKAVIPFLNEQNDVVKNIQACNCIKIKDGRLNGYNTDVAGFEQSLKPLLQPHHKKALILGTGGASAAVEYVLENMNIEFKFVSRDADNKHNTIAYDDVDETVLNQYHLIINTTPLGMFPSIESYPEIPYQYINSNHLLYDLVYNPSETIFLQKGKEQGASIKNGEEMLIIQAEESWRIWNEK